MTAPLGRALVDKRLYLPESWASDKGRCAAAGVPEERQGYWSKTELAVELLERALGLVHLRAEWVAGNDAFGMSPSFREALAALGMRYVLDVPGSTPVRPLELAWTSPEYPGFGRPRKPKLRDGQRDPEMRQAKKGNQYHFGMKLHIGVDSATGLVDSFSATSANVHDVTEAHRLLHGEESQVWGIRATPECTSGRRTWDWRWTGRWQWTGTAAEAGTGESGGPEGKGQGIDTGQEPAPESHRGWNTPFRT